MDTWKETAPGVFYRGESGLVRVVERELDQLIEAARRTPQRRARLCAHPNPEDSLHEMLICLLRDGYVRPHRHSKVESACVLRGEADLVLFEEDGRVRESIPLGPVGSGKTCFVRISSPVFHTYLLRSDELIFLETTRGPLDPAASEFAVWAPSDAAAGAVYSRQLREQIP